MTTTQSHPANVAPKFGTITGTLSLVQSPFALLTDRYREIQSIAANHLLGAKFDIVSAEQKLGFSLAPITSDYTIESSVAVIEIEGMLLPRRNILHRIFGATSTQWVEGQLVRAIEDPRVKSIVLKFDSPGGTVFGVPELAACVAHCARVKPVVAFTDAMLTSAAYWVGAAANAVVVSGPTVQVGGIGIVASHTYDAQAGQMVTEVKAGRYKAVASSARPLSEEGASYMQDQVNYLYSVFVDAVAGYRGVTPAHCAETMADGRTFIGQQAINVGLADQSLRFSELIDAMATNPAQFANRRRVAATRVQLASPRTGAVAASAATALKPATVPIVPKILTREQQAHMAVAHAKKHQISIVQALKDLNFAT